MLTVFTRLELLTKDPFLTLDNTGLIKLVSQYVLGQYFGNLTYEVAVKSSFVHNIAELKVFLGDKIIGCKIRQLNHYTLS